MIRYRQPVTNYISKEDTQNFNILCNKKIIEIEDYIELDKFVAQILNEPASNIIKNCIIHNFLS